MDGLDPSLLDRLLAACARREASDVHLGPNLRPYFRVHGQLSAAEDWPVVAAPVTEQLAAELCRRGGRAPLGERGSIDGAITSAEGVRFRFNVFRRQHQMAIALRRLEDRFRTLPELGLPAELYALGDLPDGLVVVAGPTGAGKSTTLATLIDRINRRRACHIVTIEDPIEYLHSPILSLVNQRQVHADTASFHEALVDSLRQDPDVVLVGEIRDLPTIRTAITAAETGHLVFTTVHAGDCVGTIERLVSVFPSDEQNGVRRQLALVLRAIVAQHLLICDGPRGAADNVREDAPAAANAGEAVGSPVTRRRERVVAAEILWNNTAIANLIATGKSAQIYSALEVGGASGMRTLEEDLARLCARGLITEATALAMARNASVLKSRLAMLRGSAALAMRGAAT